MAYHLYYKVVSIHAPWEGCDFCAIVVVIVRVSFNSRTLGRVRLETSTNILRMNGVSIHAPWEGCDDRVKRKKLNDYKFQFTHPGKGATSYLGCEIDEVIVSIHAPWEGCDVLLVPNP